ncbi:protein kinase domain-containing protein [Calothrix sp. CCY 0018]|uniref:protein kinase domain-containing protein n=1 Tax=Calothrix sp. CCY 0018 TaxID=3103864 RepID=UPI0039C6A919
MMTPTQLNHRYQVIKVLASGGFGETYLAEDTQMPSKRKCVIKQLKPVEHNPQIYQLVQERFQREAALLEELSDGKNQIPQLYAYFTNDEQFYLIQEYIEGDTLTKKVQQQGILSEASVKEILINILPVLDYIHGKRIVHRDIKPDNILIRHSDRKPVLIDFGAVKETMQTVVAVSENSAKSIVIGTPGFMPSEQTAGRPVYSSDLYSLGLTAIYLLTGKIPQELPNNPSTGEIIWREYAPNITSSFAAVFDKAIQSHSRDRFATAKEMLQALQTEAIPLPPTVPYIPAPSTQPPTEISTPAAQTLTQAPTTVVNRGMKDWQKATIIGTVIGVCAIGGISIINKPSANLGDASNTTNLNQTANKPAQQSSNPNNFTPATSSITREAAISVLNQWQDAKRELFAPPFDRNLGAELTTGEAYRKNVGTDSSLEWLENNNSYYRYGVQKIDSVEKFIASNNRATIDIVVTEDRIFYQSGEIVPGENTSFDTRLIRYSLQLEDGSLKISDYKTIDVISIH